MIPWSKLCRAGAKNQRALQEHLLQKLLRERIPYSPFYRKLFEREEIAFHKIKTLADFRRVPFTTKADLLSTVDEPEKYKQFILQPNETLLRAHLSLREKLKLLEERLLHGRESARRTLFHEYYPVFLTFTTGRSAAPLAFAYTQHDLDILQLSGLRLIDVMGIPQAARTVNLFPYAPHLAFWQVTMAGFAAGRMILSTGGGKVLGTAGNAAALARMKANCIIGVPGFVYHVLRHAVTTNMRLPDLQTVVLGAEKVSIEFKQKIAGLCELLGARNVQIFGTYGSTELRMAFAECPGDLNTSTGYHSSPDLVLLECIDPRTGEPAREGDDGELVITPLQGTGSSLLRYRTGDLLKGGLRREPCENCGRTVPRIPSRIDRVSDVTDLKNTKIKGTLVNLADFGYILSGMPEVDEWQVEICKHNGDAFDVDELHLYIAPHNGIMNNNEARPALAEKITNRLRAATELAPNAIYFESLENLLSRIGMESEPKEKRFIDRRGRQAG